MWLKSFTNYSICKKIKVCAKKKKQTIFSFSSVFQCLRVDLDELIWTHSFSQSSVYSDFTKKKKLSYESLERFLPSFIR